MNCEKIHLPTGEQKIVRVRAIRDQNLHEVEMADKSECLISIPIKFRDVIHIEIGDFLLIQPVEEDAEAEAEMVRLLTKADIDEFKRENLWPEEFVDEMDEQPIEEEEDMIVNKKCTVKECYHNFDRHSDSDSVTETASHGDSEIDSDWDDDNGSDIDPNNNDYY